MIPPVLGCRLALPEYIRTKKLCLNFKVHLSVAAPATCTVLLKKLS